VNTLLITYRFDLPNGQRHSFVVELDSDTGEYSSPAPAETPEWTQLAFHQCSGCPFSANVVRRCPVAVRLSEVIDRFADLVSYDQLQVTAETEERAVTATITAQQGLASLMGLIMASSGCPHTAVFRPMARFHLPFSSELETAFRVASMYLLAQHFAAREGVPVDIELKNLANVYQGVHQVNRGIAQRLRAAIRQDAIVNAVVLLDVYTSLVPGAVEELLSEIKPTFSALLNNLTPPILEK
jgi:hypothetical protein